MPNQSRQLLGRTVEIALREHYQLQRDRFLVTAFAVAPGGRSKITKRSDNDRHLVKVMGFALFYRVIKLPSETLMEFSYTKHQTPRGARADAEVGDKLYLIKSVSQLRLTYQIKMLTYMAQIRNKKLIIRLPKAAKVHESLKTFVRDMDGLIKVERT
jgi:hypothetical protein